MGSQLGRAARQLWAVSPTGQTHHVPSTPTNRSKLSKTASQARHVENLMVQHNDLEEIRWSESLKKGKMKNPKGSSTPIQLMFYSNSIPYWDEGRQYVNDFQYLLTRRSFLDAGISAPNPIGGQLPEPLFDYDPNVETTGTNAVSAVIPDGTSTLSQYVYVKQIQSNNTYVSLTNLPMEFDILWFTPKKYTNLTPSQAWAAELSTIRLGQSAAGQNDGVGATAGYQEVYYPGKSPMQVAAFRKYYKLIHEDKFILQPGSRLKINSTFKINKIVRKNLLANQDSDYVYIPGVTVIPMMIAKGAAALVKNGSDPARMSYAFGKVGILSENKISFSTGSFEEKFAFSRVYPYLHNQSFTSGNLAEVQAVDVGDQTVSQQVVDP